MRTWNFGTRHTAAVFLRLCLVTIIALSLAMGGMALNPEPVHATGINPAGPVSYNLPVCIPWQQQFTITPSCPSGTVFYWLVGGGIPAFVNLDQNTGLLTACPDQASAGTSASFQVWCTELKTFPFCFGFAIADVTLNFQPNTPPCVTAINPTFYPVAWEGMPFTMTMTATGGAGPLHWTATGLPSGLSVTDVTNGVISGIPGPGTCGIYTVTATVTDNGTCPVCCPAISRPFILIVDCWANYLSIFYYSTACDFQVAIGTGLTQGQTNVWIDGLHKAILAGGQSENFISVPCESHLVMVDQTVQVPYSDTRFSAVGSNTKMVTDVDNYAYFDYAQEVFIQTASEPAVAIQPPGAGYYTVGSTFSSTAPGTIETDIQNGIKYVFREWRLPDGTTRPFNDLLFIVNQEGTVTASYDNYYLLTLRSDYPAINEISWEKAGSTATWNLSLPAVPVESGFWRFLGVSQTPVNPSGSQLMNGPSTVEILWRPNYLPAIIAILITLLVIAGVVYLIYRLRSRPAAKPAARARAKKAPPRAKKPAAKKRTTRTRKRTTR